MLSLTNLFCFLLLRFVTASPQINLDLTDWIGDNGNNITLQHDCLHVAARRENETDPYQIISYCMSESSLKWNIHVNNLNQTFTFDDLYELNITSEQLYLWSASIDVIERYQLFLNQSSSSNEFLSMATQLFVNCTLPRFGPLCQYSLEIFESNHLSLNEIIHAYYQQEYNPTTLTCYTHLQCNRGSDLACLDWSEICDRFIDCQDGVDEEHCWQLENNECEDSEYRCSNGQCIPIAFSTDNVNTFECLDRTDEFPFTLTSIEPFRGEPTFAHEDVACQDRYVSFEVRFTSSCVLGRQKLLMQAMFSNKPDLVSDVCWSAIKCRLNEQYLLDSTCDNINENQNLEDIIQKTCPNMFVIPNRPVAFGHIYFAYTKEYFLNSPIFRIPQYICYNEQLCGGFYPNRAILSYNNMTCRRPNEFPVHLSEHLVNPVSSAIRSLYRLFFKCNTIVYNDPGICNSASMYRCINSTKCISNDRRCDTMIDCDYADDEQCSFVNDTCSINEYITHFKCTTNNICIHPFRVRNHICDCGVDEYGLCDDEPTQFEYRKHIAFPTICDGFTELAPVIIDGRNETDETECEQWQCNNTYTRCDGFWNCLNGADEVDCDLSPLLKCPLHHHICVSPVTNQFICLPLEKANDGNFDCLGGTDEPKLCRANNHQFNDANFHCMNHTEGRCINSSKFCFKTQCKSEVDKQFCDSTRNNTISQVCDKLMVYIRSDVENFFCARRIDTRKVPIVYFSLDSERNATNYTSNEDEDIQIRHLPTARQYDQRCHRGLGLRVWLNDTQNLTTRTCLCPPSFYGDRCQYQNQRVSLTMRFHTFSDSRQTLFVIVVLLIDNDDERVIHSHEQFTYLYIRQCKIKFNIYLVYSSRPKNESKTYSIHIDIYEKISLAYRGSLLSSLKFPFLPVHRIALQLQIPRTNEKMKTCSEHRCGRGQCVHYSNDPHGIAFCHCEQGWSGKYCTIEHKCTCSSGSLCIGVLTNNRSLCVCPINKWGPQCLLRGMICQVNKNGTCHNGGQCISRDENVVSDQKFLCICPKGFTGDRCEIPDTELILSFDRDINLPQYIFVHFIEVMNNGQPVNGSTFKAIPINNNSVTVYWPRPFHIAVVQFLDNNNYYLITVQKPFDRSTPIIQTINPSNRCKYISEVLNETIRELHLLRRIKYYHVPCQKPSLNLSCFYDDTHFCICNHFGLQRLANCFEFNYRRKLDCSGESNCENGAQCLQDSFACPQTSVCACPSCFYGTRCQFSSNLFGLSLDAILGYHIQPHITITSQPAIVQISIVLTIIMTIGGLVNGILSLITFKNKEARQTGCGLYLLYSAITTLFTISIFTLKFWILIIAQITYIENRLFLLFQCHSIDFFLRVGLNMDQWLSACVAIERATSSIQGTGFNKQKSKQMAKYIIFILSFLIIITNIHDPIYRRLIDDNDNDEKRIWCIVTYSSHLQIYNSAMNIFHFFLPFLINLISAIIIIKNAIRQQTNVQHRKMNKQLFREQCLRHNHLFIAPVILVILGTPRLIISFVSGCMKSSSNNSYMFLAGYFISFIQLILHFVVFVLPSTLFKEEFQKCIRQYRQMIRTRLCCAS